MIHLITIVGKHAKKFYLEPQRLSDFKSLMRTITSGRVMIVSTKFRSDLFYSAEKPASDAILKLWAFLTNTDLPSFEGNDILIYEGDETALSEYFQAINHLSTNWLKYRLYKKAFNYSFSNDHHNPMARTIAGCDQHILHHSSIKRAPLFIAEAQINADIKGDTLLLAMRIINNGIHSN